MKPALLTEEALLVIASVPQSCEKEIEAMARKYRNVVFCPVHVQGDNTRAIMQWKVEWEKNMLDCFDKLPDVHPAFLYEADTDPYARKTTRDDGSANNMSWDTSKFTSSAQMQQEIAKLKQHPNWMMVYHVIEGGGRGCEAERASIDAVFRPVAEMEKQKRKNGKSGKIIEFRYYKSGEEALQDFKEAEDCSYTALMDMAKSNPQTSVASVRQMMFNSGIVLDDTKRELRCAMPGETP